jgi:putative transposase
MEFHSHTKQSENGALSSVSLMRTACDAEALAPGPVAPRRSVPQDQWPHSLPLRAVDQDGDVLDILVQTHRDTKAAKKFFRKVLKGLRYVPRVIITDKLRSYHAAIAEVLPRVEHLQQKQQNNRAENSHQPTRLRKRVMRRFKSAGQAQRFLSAFGIITSHFRVGRHHYTAPGYREVMKSRFAVWQDVVCAEAIGN